MTTDVHPVTEIILDDGTPVDADHPLPVVSEPATATANAETSSVPSANVDTLILAENGDRRGATVYNNSTQVLYLLLGTGVASAALFTVAMASGSYYEAPFGYTGEIRGAWAAANGAALVSEFSA